MKKTLFLSLFTLLLFVRIEAQWTEIPLLMGPVLDDLEVHEGKVYTTFYTGGRVKCLSTEDYIHWSLVANLQGIAAFGDAAFIAAGNRLYVFGENEGQSASNAWQSEDGGQNWSAINLPAPAPSFFVPASENLLCASEFVVKSSADYGATWNTVLTVPEKIRDFKKINDQTFLLATFHNLYRSTDQGLTWNALSAPYSISNPNTSRLTIFPAGTVLFLEVNNSSASMLFRTLDEGTTWDLAQVPVLNGNPAVWDMCPVGNTLWGAFQNVIATSVDTGNTWNLQLTPYGPLQLANKGDTLFVGGGAGFFKSYNQAKSWISGNNGWSQAGYFTGYSLPAENIYADQHRLYLSAHNAACSLQKTMELNGPCTANAMDSGIMSIRAIP